ncbi:MAG: hypothetical protein R2684_16440 [Pyrinomonadaceae bacterium]
MIKYGFGVFVLVVRSGIQGILDIVPIYRAISDFCEAFVQSLSDLFAPNIGGYSYSYATHCGWNSFVDVVKLKLERQKWRILVEGDEHIVVRIPFNWSTPGEIVRISHSNGRVRISSECVNPFQLFDWGKNRKNVEKILGIIVSAEECVSPISDGQTISSVGNGELSEKMR